MERRDAMSVVALLSAAFPIYPVNDDTTTLYVDALSEKVVDARTAMNVVADWVQTRTTFPTIAELLVECSNEAARQTRKTAALEAPSGPCGNCGGDRFEQVEGGVIPCHVCDPVRNQDWRDGHNLPEHDFEACDWTLCQQRSKSKTRSRGQSRALAKQSPPPDRRYESERF